MYQGHYHIGVITCNFLLRLVPDPAMVNTSASVIREICGFSVLYKDIYFGIIFMKLF